MAIDTAEPPVDTNEEPVVPSVTLEPETNQPPLRVRYRLETGAATPLSRLDVDRLRVKWLVNSGVVALLALLLFVAFNQASDNQTPTPDPVDDAASAIVSSQDDTPATTSATDQAQGGLSNERPSLNVDLDPQNEKSNDASPDAAGASNAETPDVVEPDSDPDPEPESTATVEAVIAGPDGISDDNPAPEAPQTETDPVDPDPGSTETETVTESVDPDPESETTETETVNPDPPRPETVDPDPPRPETVDPDPPVVPTRAFRVVPIPGKVQAEHFDTGGSGRSFGDTDGQNYGGALREGAVDVYSTYGESGYTVGRTRGGEWLEYTVTIDQPGRYVFRARVASGWADPGTMSITVDGNPWDTLDVANTGGWWSWAFYETGTIDLNGGGAHTIRVTFGGEGQINFDSFDLRRI